MEGFELPAHLKPAKRPALTSSHVGRHVQLAMDHSDVRGRYCAAGSTVRPLGWEWNGSATANKEIGSLWEQAIPFFGPRRGKQYRVQWRSETRPPIKLVSPAHDGYPGRVLHDVSLKKIISVEEHVGGQVLLEDGTELINGSASEMPPRIPLKQAISLQREESSGVSELVREAIACNLEQLEIAGKEVNVGLVAAST
jgi:hypothetical protein